MVLVVEDIAPVDLCSGMRDFVVWLVQEWLAAVGFGLL